LRAQEQSSPALLTDSKSWIMTSASKRTYQISVDLPDGYSKELAPYQVLYAANANAEFGTIVEAARLGSFAKEIQDLVIVGIGYPNPGQGFKNVGLSANTA
jgi:predicted alpha/beta superfamily hydrolase